MKDKLLINFKSKIVNIINTLLNDIIAVYFMKKPSIGSVNEAIDKIVNEGLSMSRFGDGEFSLIYGQNLKFQKYDIQLAKELRDILINEDDRLLVCVPDVFDGLEQYTSNAKKYWKKYLHNNRKRILNLLSRRKYYNTQITRFYIDYVDKKNTGIKVNNLKKLWNQRNVLIVEGEQSRLGVGNDFFGNSKSITRIICPSISAYSKIDLIEQSIIKYSKDKLVLLALGPTATVLASRLSKRNIQALDIGHIDIEYEWYLMRALEKCPVKSKYIGEIPGGDCVSELKDELYLSEIVERIL